MFWYDIILIGNSQQAVEETPPACGHLPLAGEELLTDNWQLRTQKMDNEQALVLYEEGRAVSEIAEAMGVTPPEINDLLSKSDDTQTVEVVRQDRHVRGLRRVRSLADGIIQVYLENLQETLADPKSTAEQRKAALADMDMDKVLRIAKLTSDRVLLAEGKTTENVGLNGSAEIPFTVVFTETYETPKGTTEDTEKV